MLQRLRQMNLEQTAAQKTQQAVPQQPKKAAVPQKTQQKTKATRKAARKVNVNTKIVLPRKIWIQIVSHVTDPITLCLLSVTDLESIVAMPTSNVWSIAHAAAVANGKIDASVHLFEVLQNAAYHRMIKPGENTTNEKFLECVHLFVSNKCNSCILTTDNIFWRFEKRLCGCCVFRHTITDDALVHAFGSTVVKKIRRNLPYEFIGKLGWHEHVLYNHENENYLYADVEKLLGYDIMKDESGLLDYFEESKRGNYKERKAIALTEMQGPSSCGCRYC